MLFNYISVLAILVYTVAQMPGYQNSFITKHPLSASAHGVFMSLSNQFSLKICSLSTVCLYLLCGGKICPPKPRWALTSLKCMPMLPMLIGKVPCSGLDECFLPFICRHRL